MAIRDNTGRFPMPEITEDTFCENIEREDFCRQFGNPVLVHGKNQHDYVCMAWEYYQRIMRRLSEWVEDENIKYWIYEFEMPQETRQKLEAVCALHELTENEFFEAAVKEAIQQAEADPEGFKQRCLEAEDPAECDIRLVRCYPVYKGETEAQAYRRILAEEAAQADETAQAGEGEQ